jgi:hypothetical protein
MGIAFMPQEIVADELAGGRLRRILRGPSECLTSRHVAGLATPADAVRLVEEELPIAESRLRILIDRDLDGLDVHPAPAFVT